MACGFDELQIAAVCHFECVDKEGVHKHVMAWILIASAIPVTLWDSHGERAGWDLDHRRTVFARRWRDRGLRRLISCEERGHVEQDTETSRNKKWSDRHRGGLLAQDRKLEDRTIAGSEGAATGLIRQVGP